MNTRPAALRPQFAFTLIELITVIAIIAILMGLLFPAMSGARDAARRSQAGTVIKGIVNSVKSYANDYGKFPPVASASSGGGGSASSDMYYSFGDTSSGKCAENNDELFDVLRAIDRGANAQHALNKRQQKYFEEKKAVDPKNPREGFADGKDFEDSIQGRLLDPWGKQYCVVLDGDGDEVLKISNFFSDVTDDLRYSAVSFSLGKNGEIGGKGYQGRLRKSKSSEAPEDIVSWE